MNSGSLLCSRAGNYCAAFLIFHLEQEQRRRGPRESTYFRK